MKKLSILFISFFIALLCTGSAVASHSGPQESLNAKELDPQEKTDLFFTREEEKLARDSYITLNDLWSDRVFKNISRSEQRHMNAMLKMLTLYDLPDPVTDDTVGVFTNPILESLYDELMVRGAMSELEALRVGAFIEEMDIQDLAVSISNTDELPLINSYTNLLAGSRNHLRAFVAHIIASGEDYVAQVLTPDEVEAIVGDYDLPPPRGFMMNNALNDAWYYPGTDGQGFTISVFPGQRTVFLVWFTYDTELAPHGATARLGDPGQRWIVAQGSYWDGEAELEVGSMSGGRFDSGQSRPNHDPRGSILLQFEDCNTGSVFYDIPSIGRTGMVPIQRVNTENVAQCREQQEREQQARKQNGQN